jgi:hypothetical protein
METRQVVSRQTVYEVHTYDLTEEQFKEFRKIKGAENKQEFLDNIGGSAAEYEPMVQFKFETGEKFLPLK